MTPVIVATAAELQSALQNAKGGETILLKGGDYGGLSTTANLGYDGPFASTVTIASQDPNDPATFSGLYLYNTGNIVIEDVVFDYTRSEDDVHFTRPFQVKDSTNVTIKNSVFDGDTKPYVSESGVEDLGWAYGLSVRNASEITLEGNEFYDWIRGAVIDNVENIIVRENDVHDIRSDGMDFVNVQNVLIEDNHFHDFKAAYGSADHRDMIQFWTSGTTTPSTDIIIRNNLLDMGEGSYTQSIFMRNEAVDSQGGGLDMYYQNVLIEGNTIYNSHLHGITVGETDGLIIRENSLVAVTDPTNPEQTNGGVWVPTINVNKRSTDVSIEQNVTLNINGHEGQSDWSVQNNALIQNSNPFGAGHYGDVFVTSSMDVGPNGHNYVTQPDSIIDQMGAGPSDIGRASNLADQEALFMVEALEQNVRVFDAGLSLSALAGQGIDESDYVWDFGDGTTGTGSIVSHTYQNAGLYDVRLTVNAGGISYTADSSVGVRGAKAVSLDTSAGAFVSHAYGEQEAFSKLSAFENNALQLVETGTAASISISAVSELRGNDKFDIDFTLKGAGAGEVFRLHTYFTAWVTEAGEFKVSVYNQDGDITTLSSSGSFVTDGNEHDISIQLDGSTLRLIVDTVTVETNSFEGTLPTSTSWGLVFGNPWGKANYAGEILAFEVFAGHDSKPEEEMASYSEPVQELLENSWHYNDVVLEPAILDGNHIDLGRLSQFEESDRIAFSVEFTIDEMNGSDSRLIWNHLKLGLTIKNGEVLVQAPTSDGEFKGFGTEGLGLTKGEQHTASVLLDSENDRLQVIVNDQIVIDVNSVDFDHVGAGGREWGWSLGTAWGHDFIGEVSSFQVSNQFQFQEPENLEEEDGEVFIPANQDIFGNSWSFQEVVKEPVTLYDSHVDFGRLVQFEDSDAIAFSVNFTTDEENGSDSRLVWNHLKLGLTLRDDEILVQAATQNEGFKAFATEGLGLTKGEEYNATVLLDSSEDRLQVLVNDELVLDITEVDFDHIGAGGREWGWSLGTPWDRDFKGEISSFEISDQFDFQEVDGQSNLFDLTL